MSGKEIWKRAETRFREVDEQTPVRTKLGTLVTVVLFGAGLLITAVFAWANLSFKVGDLIENKVKVEARQDAADAQISAMRPMLERIDERTASTQRDLSDIMARRP